MMEAREEGQAMTDEIIRDNVFTFMVGGFETTSTALSWTLYALSIVRKIGFLSFYEAKTVSHDSKEKSEEKFKAYKKQIWSTFDVITLRVD